MVRIKAVFESAVPIYENQNMQVQVNGETREIPAELSLAELLDHLSMPSRLLAIELNKEVVRRKDWHDIKVNEADTIEIIHFVGGG